MRAREYNRHFRELCKKHNIKHEPLSGHWGESKFRVDFTSDGAWVNKRISSPEVSDLKSYSIGLHEVAHIAYKLECPFAYKKGVVTRRLMDIETEAWHRALVLAKGPLDMDTIAKCLGQYLSEYRRTHSSRPLPKRHPIWQLIHDD